MSVIKSFCVMWLFLLSIISDIYSSEYLHFGGTEEEPREAKYYLSTDGGANIAPKDDLKRTQRSFWKLLKYGLFGECRNCYNNCNYNVKNGNNCNSRPSSSLPFQPWRPLPLWRPLVPLFGRTNYENCKNNYADANSNNYDGAPSYIYNNNGINGPINNDNYVPPETLHEISTDLPPTEPGYQVDNSPVTQDKFEPETKAEISTYANEEALKNPQHPNEKYPQIIYQPIIYVSPQYRGNKPLNQVKQEEPQYYGESKEFEKSQPPSYESGLDNDFKQPMYNSNVGKINLDDSSTVMPYSQTVGSNVLNLSYPPKNPSFSTVATVYNIITPPLLNSQLTCGNPHTAKVTTDNVLCSNGNPSKYSLHSSNPISLDSQPLYAQATIGSYPSLFPVADAVPGVDPSIHTCIEPIQLTADDQPYRACPELFNEYQRKVNNFLSHIRGGAEDSFANARPIHY